MFIRLEDWSHPIFFSQIQRKGVPHGDRFIKIFASEENPRLYTAKPIHVFESSGTPFRADEMYQYPNRDSFTGMDLEKEVQHLMLSSHGQERVRALFRFAHHDIGIIPHIMSVQENGEWVFSHPFEEIDGIRPTKKFYGNKELDIHIDIFHPSSLAVLRQSVDLTDSTRMLNFREGRILKQHLSDPEKFSLRLKEQS